MMIGVLDYKAGNLKSVKNALACLGAAYFVSSDADKLLAADKLIFPGVGHAASAMARLNESGLAEILKSYASSGKPLLGICLGSQILLEHSEEGNTPCLGLIKGRCVKFKNTALKVPQIGWNRVEALQKHYLFDGIEQGSFFYFVHSDYNIPDSEENALASTSYGIKFVSALCRDNICAVQFHPERSGAAGLKMLENFVKAG